MAPAIAFDLLGNEAFVLSFTLMFRFLHSTPTAMSWVKMLRTLRPCVWCLKPRQGGLDFDHVRRSESSSVDAQQSHTMTTLERMSITLELSKEMSEANLRSSDLLPSMDAITDSGVSALVFAFQSSLVFWLRVPFSPVVAEYR